MLVHAEKRQTRDKKRDTACQVWSGNTVVRGGVGQLVWLIPWHRMVVAPVRAYPRGRQGSNYVETRLCASRVYSSH